jgi:hypothetical protein
MYINLAIVTLLTFVLNLPFGYWRSNVKKFSFLWFLYVHLPIPFIVLMRFGFHLGFQWWTYPFLVGAFFSGQLLGKKLGKKKELNSV